MTDFPADFEGELLHPDELEHLLTWLRTHPYAPGGPAWDEPLETGGHGDVTADAIRALWGAQHEGFEADGTERAVLEQRLAALSYGRCGQTYTQAATTRLVEAYVPLVKRLLRLHASAGIVEQNPNLLDAEDVLQTALVGLLVAIDEAPLDRPDVTNPVAVAARRWVSKELSTLYGSIFTAQVPQRTRERFAEIMRKAGGDATLAEELAPAQGMTAQTFRDVYIALAPWDRTTHTTDDYEGYDLADRLDPDGETDQPEPWQTEAQDSTWEDYEIDARLSRLSDRERRVVAGHFGLTADGKQENDTALGEALGVHRSRVAHIRATALGKLRENVTAA